MSVLIILSSSYPTKKGDEFIIAELKFAHRYYENIFIIPDTLSNNNFHETPDYVQTYHNYSKIGLYKNLFSIFMKRFLYKEFFASKICCNKSKFRDFLINIFLSSKKMAVIESLMISKKMNYDDCDFYAYWGSWSALSLARFKLLNHSMNCFTRVHGGDVFEEQQVSNYLPFRGFIYNSIRVFSISNRGIEHIIKSYPKAKNNIFLSRLGTEEIINQDKTKSSNVFTILSCSSVNENKRVDLILESVILLAKKSKKLQFEWIHIGDGPNFNDLKSKASCNISSNCIIKLLGHVSQSTIKSFYINNYVDVFINLSSSEGIPVSIMEATSCYIPVIATNVGGSSEALPSKQFLIENNAEIIDQVIQAIYKILNIIDQKELRQGYRKYWEDNYSDENNYLQFYQAIRRYKNEKPS